MMNLKVDTLLTAHPKTKELLTATRVLKTTSGVTAGSLENMMELP